MSDRVFFDTNIFLYAHDQSDDNKRLGARELLFKHYTNGTSAISTQVLAEFFQNYVIKFGAPYVSALKEMHFMCAGLVIEQTISLLLAGAKIWREYSLSYWDSLIVAAAKKADANTLYTEDMHHGQDIDGVVITNPFI